MHLIVWVDSRDFWKLERPKFIVFSRELYVEFSTGWVAPFSIHWSTLCWALAVAKCLSRRVPRESKGGASRVRHTKLRATKDRALNHHLTLWSDPCRSHAADAYCQLRSVTWLKKNLFIAIHCTCRKAWLLNSSYVPWCSTVQYSIRRKNPPKNAVRQKSICSLEHSHSFR